MRETNIGVVGAKEGIEVEGEKRENEKEVTAGNVAI